MRREAFDVDAAADGAAALQLTAVHDYAVITLDLMMPRVNGFEFLAALHNSRPDSRAVIFITTAFDDAQIGKLAPSQVAAVIRKPFDVPQLINMIREVALMSQAQQQSTGDEPLLSRPSAGDEIASDEPAN